MDQSSSTTNLLSQKSSSLVDQVFNSSLFRHKDSSLTGGLASGKVLDSRAEGRGRPIWTVDDRGARLSPLDIQVKLLQVYMSLNMLAGYKVYVSINMTSLRLRSLWTLTTWSSGWTTSTLQAMMVCWGVMRLVSVGQRYASCSHLSSLQWLSFSSLSFPFVSWAK